MGGRVFGPWCSLVLLRVVCCWWQPQSSNRVFNRVSGFRSSKSGNHKLPIEKKISPKVPSPCLACDILNRRPPNTTTKSKRKPEPQTLDHTETPRVQYLLFFFWGGGGRKTRPEVWLPHERWRGSLSLGVELRV